MLRIYCQVTIDRGSTESPPNQHKILPNTWAATVVDMENDGVRYIRDLTLKGIDG
jgi:hypothetical protein